MLTDAEIAAHRDALAPAACHGGDAARAHDLAGEVLRLRAALVEREARIIWETDQRRPWRYAREADRAEYRDYARRTLVEAGLLPGGE